MKNTNEEHYGVEAKILGSTRVSGNGYLNEGLASSLLAKQMGKKVTPGTAKFLVDRLHMSKAQVAGHTTHRTDIQYSDIHRMYTFETKEHIFMLAIDGDFPDTHYYQSYQFRSNDDYTTAKRILLGEFHAKTEIEPEQEPEPYYKQIRKVYGGSSPSFNYSRYDSLPRVNSEYSVGNIGETSTPGIRTSRPNYFYVNNVGFSEGKTYHEKPRRSVLTSQQSGPRPPVVIYPLDQYQNGYSRSIHVEEQPRDYTIHRVPTKQTTHSVRPYKEDQVLRRVSRVNPNENV